MRRTLRAVALGAGLGLTVAACGSVANPLAHLTTERAIGQSFTNLFDQPGVSVQLSLATTPAQLTQALAQSDPTAKVPAGAVSGLASTTIGFTLHTGDGQPLSSVLGHPSAGTPGSHEQGDLSLTVGQKTPVELRFLGTVLYARADLPTTVAAYGADPSVAAKADQAIDQAGQAVPGLGALAKGGWVSADLGPLLKQATVGSPTTVSPAVSSRLLTSVRNALAHNASFANSGTHDGRTEYTISVALHGFVTELLNGAQQALGSNPAASLLQSLSADAARIPANQRAVIQEWVKGDRAEELDIDLAQFDHALHQPLPLRMMLESAAPVTAPSGATPVDVSSLGGLLSSVPGLSGGLGGAGGGLGGLSAGDPPGSVPTGITN